MEILNLGNNSEDSVAPVTPKSKKLKVAKAAVGIGTLASLTGLGSTLAANISLNNDANVEFGQGVAQTAACDEDGFTITPVSYYDATSSVFRLDYVEVSGLNLTPIGTNWDLNLDASGVSQFGYTDIANAIAAHPGQYYDTTDNAWTNTCDRVVLDFKAYTDDETYSTNTVDGYAALHANNTLPNTTSSPLLWVVAGNGGVVGEDASNVPYSSISDFAVIFDARWDNSNYGSVQNSWDSTYFTDNMGIDNPQSYGTDSTFQFFTSYGHHAGVLNWYNAGGNYDPAAGPISKITVESMKYFPSGYENGAEANGDQAYESVWGDYGYYYLGSQYVPE